MDKSNIKEEKTKGMRLIGLEELITTNFAFNREGFRLILTINHKGRIVNSSVIPLEPSEEDLIKIIKKDIGSNRRVEDYDEENNIPEETKKI